jgi:hypothetical protein
MFCAHHTEQIGPKGTPELFCAYYRAICKNIVAACNRYTHEQPPK